MILLHQCQLLEMVAMNKMDPVKGAKKCRCRQRITEEEANKMLDEDRARRVVTKRWYEPIDIACKLCKGDPEVKRCARCFGVGTEKVNATREEYGNAIVAVSAQSVDKEDKYRPAQALKTPRVATIEKKHIYRAYLSKGKDGQEDKERIEAYGLMILETQASLISGYEPEDDIRTRSGRRFDYGRAI